MEENSTVSGNIGEVAATPTTQETTVAPQQSVTNSEVATPNVVQTEEQNRAFAQLRREAERAKKADEIISKIYAEHGIKSIDELETALRKQEEDAQKENYRQKGIDPDSINELIDKHPLMQEAKKMKEEAAAQAEFNKQADELFKEFPKLNAKDVPMEVLKMNKEQKIPLAIAYKAYMFGNVKKDTEQEVIQNMKLNQQTSPGSLSAGGADNKTKLPAVGTKEFRDLLKKVERGEITDLSQL